MRRGFAIGVGAVLIVLLVLVGMIIWIFATESGTRFAAARAAGFVPEGVEWGQVQGRLLDEVRFHDIRVATDAMVVTVARAALRWKPADLLDGHLQVHELALRGVRYQALPGPEPVASDEPFLLPERVELPVSVAVDRLLVEDVTAVTAPDGEPVTVDRLALAARFADSELRVSRLELDMPGLSGQGQVRLAAAGDYPVDGELRWRFRPPGYAPLPGETDLAGSLQTLEVKQRLGAPYNTSVDATLENLLSSGAPADEPLAVAATVSVAQLTLASVGDDLPEATVSLDAEVAGPLDALTIRAEASGRDPQQREFTATLGAMVSGEQVSIQRLIVTQPGREGRLEGRGQLALAGAMAADVEVRWRSLRWPLTGTPMAVSPRGTLTFTGPLDDYRFALDARLQATPGPPVDLALTGTGSREQVALELTAQAEDGRVRGEVTAAWSPDISGDLALTASDLDPALLAAGWPGELNGALRGSVAMRGDTLSASLDSLDLQGSLRERPLTLTARGAFEQGPDSRQVTVEVLDAALGGTALEIRGRVGDEADLTWRLESEDLAAVTPEARGTLRGSGGVNGELPEVSLTADLSGQSLTYGDYALERFELEADVDLTGDTRSAVAVAATGGEFGGTALERLTIALDGTPAAHTLSLNADLEDGRGELGLAGALEAPWSDDPRWRFRLDDGTIAYADLAPWVLTEPAEGLLGASVQRLERLCWQADEAGLCLAGRNGDDGLSAELDLTDLQLDYFAPFLPDDLELEGSLSATARARRSADGVLTARAEATTTAGVLRLPRPDAEDDGPRAVVGLEPSRVGISLDHREAQADAALNLEHGWLRLTATTPAALASPAAQGEAALEDRPLAGSLELEIPELAFLDELLPAVEDLAGEVGGALQVEGTVGQPLLTGAIALRGGAATLPAQGLSLRDMSLALEGRGRDGIGFDAQAGSGGGDVRAWGSLSPLGETPTASLRVVGEDFQVINNSEAQVFASPDLAIDAGAERIEITGEVRVPRAEITPGTRSPAAVTVSGDQVLVSEQGEAPATDRELVAEVRLILGDDVRFAGFGLTARVDGDVLVNEVPDTPTTATGEIRIVEGEYRAYGQGLVIEEGRIYFAGGPVTEPALDVRAVRRPEEGILVGAHVQGTLQEPEFELFSEPSMTQQEQLAYLVLGRSLDEAPDGEGSALGQAALAMGLKGGDFLAKNIGERVGLDTVGIETGSGEAGAASDPNQAALVVGKYLSPRLYVSYGIGLFNPESILEMQYDVSRNWQLVTQSSGESTGVDLLYTVELGGP